MNTKTATLPIEVIGQAINALRMIETTPYILSYLTGFDPQALRQIFSASEALRSALEAAFPDLDQTAPADQEGETPEEAEARNDAARRVKETLTYLGIGDTDTAPWIPVHAAQADSVLSACGMTHVSQTPLLGDVTCAECLAIVARKTVVPRDRPVW
jgi:hypothetical protein